MTPFFTLSLLIHHYSRLEYIKYYFHIKEIRIFISHINIKLSHVSFSHHQFHDAEKNLFHQLTLSFFLYFVQIGLAISGFDTYVIPRTFPTRNENTSRYNFIITKQIPSLLTISVSEIVLLFGICGDFFLASFYKPSAGTVDLGKKGLSI